jgi:hypothetical protein
MNKAPNQPHYQAALLLLSSCALVCCSAWTTHKTGAPSPSHRGLSCLAGRACNARRKRIDDRQPIQLAPAVASVLILDRKRLALVFRSTCSGPARVVQDKGEHETKSDGISSRQRRELGCCMSSRAPLAYARCNFPFASLGRTLFLLPSRPPITSSRTTGTEET